MLTAVATKYEILQRLRALRGKIQSLGVQRLGLFGSFVREEQRAGSDVDVLVEFQPGKKNYDSFLELALLLEEVLQREVELVTSESLSPYLRPRILAEVQYVPLTEPEQFHQEPERQKPRNKDAKDLKDIEDEKISSGSVLPVLEVLAVL